MRVVTRMERTSDRGPGAVYKRYKKALTPFVGSDAADVVTSYYKWASSGIACFVLMVPAGLVGSLTQFSGVGLGVLVAALIGGIVCACRAVPLISRGAGLASEYLTRAWDTPCISARSEFLCGGGAHESSVNGRSTRQ